jgi:hypothetical protein
MRGRGQQIWPMFLKVLQAEKIGTVSVTPLASAGETDRNHSQAAKAAGASRWQVAINTETVGAMDSRFQEWNWRAEIRKDSCLGNMRKRLPILADKSQFSATRVAAKIAVVG